jgi:hypothetical protein
MSLAGPALLWLTGVSLVLTRYHITALPVMFWFKIGFVLLLTVAAVSIELIYARVKKGDAKAAALLPSLGPMAGISSLMAVIFAVLAFH